MEIAANALHLELSAKQIKGIQIIKEHKPRLQILRWKIGKPELERITVRIPLTHEETDNRKIPETESEKMRGLTREQRLEQVVNTLASAVEDVHKERVRMLFEKWREGGKLKGYDIIIMPKP